MRKAALVATFAFGVIVATLTSLAIAQDGGDGESSPGDRVERAQEIVRDLDLPTTTGEADGCTYFVDVDNVAYCIDSVAKTDAEAKAFWNDLRGVEPSDAELAVAAAADELRAARDALAEAAEADDPEALAEARKAFDEALQAWQEANAALEAGTG
jgi:hypothetical protein